MAVAFLAGLLSFLSPCVLPVVPSYLSYVTGISGAAELRQRRHLALLHAALFVAGFTLSSSRWAPRPRRSAGSSTPTSTGSSASAGC